jgi:hypothetical protein
VEALAFTAFRNVGFDADSPNRDADRIIGIAAGIVGNLPSLSRPLQAIVLGPIVAGLTGAD